MKKEDFIVGQWYRITNGRSTSIGNDIWYGKFLRIRDSIIVTSNHIHHNLQPFEVEGNFGKLGQYTFTPIDISEINHLLSDGHPDKIIPNNNNHIKSLIKLIKNAV